MQSQDLGAEGAQRPNIFISHSHKDQIYARKIQAWLEKVGFTPWASFDECSDLYRNEIDKALLECDVFLLIASKNSFSSVEVRREITTAGSLNKPISYYKLDEASHNREGFLTLLSEKQYVQASRDNLELDKLAINAYEAFDGNINEDVKQLRENLIKDCLAIENEKYLKWREKLWSLRLDPNHNARKLSSLDRDVLQQEANRLGVIISIDDENQAFSLNKQLFSRDLIGIIAKRRIDKALLAQIEKKRLECSVPKSLALTILRNRLSKIDYLSDISISKGAEKIGHWLVTEIKNHKPVNQLQAEMKAVHTSSNDLPNNCVSIKKETFYFKHRICFLRRYVNGNVTSKMHVLSIDSIGHQLEFHGLKGTAPFSLSIPEAIKRITCGHDFLMLYHPDPEAWLSLRINKSARDYNALLKFLAKATGVTAQQSDSEKQPIISTIASSNENGLVSTKRKSVADTPKLLQDNFSKEKQNGLQSSDEPDSFFYGLMVSAIVLMITLLGIRGLYNALIALASGNH